MTAGRRQASTQRQEKAIGMGIGAFACGVGGTKKGFGAFEMGFGAFACGVRGTKKAFGGFGRFACGGPRRRPCLGKGQGRRIFLITLGVNSLSQRHACYEASVYRALLGDQERCSQVLIIG